MADIETLLDDTIAAVAQYRKGRSMSLAAAIGAGGMLTDAKALLRHGDWLAHLGKVDLQPRTAQRWMQLHATGLKCDTVAYLGGIVQTMRMFRVWDELHTDLFQHLRNGRCAECRDERAGYCPILYAFLPGGWLLTDWSRERYPTPADVAVRLSEPWPYADLDEFMTWAHSEGGDFNWGCFFESDRFRPDRDAQALRLIQTLKRVAKQRT